MPITLGFGGGGGGSSPPTTSTTNTSNLPTYVQPYVETMLGTAQQQIYNYDPSGNVTGFKPYVPYGATVDSSGNITNSAQDQAQAAVAGFSPLQQQAQQGIASLQTPQAYNQAQQATAGAGMQSLGLAGQESQAGQNFANMATDPNAIGAYMNPYLQNSLAPAQQLLNQQYGMSGAQQQGAATQQGAFGGSRNALQQGLNEQNRMLAQNQLVGNAYNQAFQNAQNQMNTGAQLGLQGQQAAMQGVGQAGQMAGQLANIGGQQLQAQSGILNAQAQQGAVQQGQQQNIINQAIQNYAAQQQYPMSQLANMSNLLHGLPMQSTTTQTYQAAPSTASQIAGLGTTGIAGLGLYNAMGGGKTA